MAITVDTFTEGADTALSAHTPDTGNQWVEVVAVGTNALTIIAAADRLGQNLNGANSGNMCKSQPSPSGAEYDVQVTMSVVDTGTSTSVHWRMHGRIADSTNYYAARFNPTGAATNDTELTKCVAGTVTGVLHCGQGIVLPARAGLLAVKLALQPLQTMRIWAMTGLAPLGRVLARCGRRRW